MKTTTFSGHPYDWFSWKVKFSVGAKIKKYWNLIEGKTPIPDENTKDPDEIMKLQCLNIALYDLVQSCDDRVCFGMVVTESDSKDAWDKLKLLSGQYYVKKM